MDHNIGKIAWHDIFLRKIIVAVTFMTTFVILKYFFIVGSGWHSSLHWHFPAFYVVLVPLLYIPSIPPHSVCVCVCVCLCMCVFGLSGKYIKLSVVYQIRSTLSLTVMQVMQDKLVIWIPTVWYSIQIHNSSLHYHIDMLS